MTERGVLMPSVDEFLVILDKLTDREQLSMLAVLLSGDYMLITDPRITKVVTRLAPLANKITRAK